jgi:hypothetical protein
LLSKPELTQQRRRSLAQLTPGRERNHSVRSATRHLPAASVGTVARTGNLHRSPERQSRAAGRLLVG